MKIINILAIDQARAGAWSIFNYETKELIEYGTFEYNNKDYTYPKFIVEIEKLIEEIIESKDISCVFIEDIQYRRNIDSFKKLAMLRGALVALFERNKYLYDYVAPTQWQNFCKARGRTTKEITAKVDKTSDEEANSKQLSIEFAREKFNVITNNDNLADAIGIGWYVVNKIPLEVENE